MESDHTNHYEATLGMHTGSFTFARPSIGAWVSYGLGTENQQPAVVHRPRPAGSRTPARRPGARDFLPGCHQGTHIVPGPDADRQPARRVAAAGAAGAGAGAAGRAEPPAPAEQRDPTPRSRPASSRSRPPSACSAKRPRRSTCREKPTPRSQLYGLERGSTGGFGWQCLVARRLAERGVRFIELIDTGSSNNWDSHGNMQDHVAAGQERRPGRSPALLTDLKQRGMLDDTLVVWTTEFGRTPYHEQADAHGPRASPPGVLVLAGRRRRQGRHRPTARPTSTASPSPRTGSTSTTSTPRSCTCSGSTTSGSPTATPAATTA